MPDPLDIESFPAPDSEIEESDLLADLMVNRGVSLEVALEVAEDFDDAKSNVSANYVHRIGLEFLRRIAALLESSELDNSVEGRALRVAISGPGDKTVEEHGRDFGKSKESFHYYVRKWREKLEF